MPNCPAASAKLPSAQAELGRQWNNQNSCQPNPGSRPDGPPCTVGDGERRGQIGANLLQREGTGKPRSREIRSQVREGGELLVGLKGRLTDRLTDCMPGRRRRSNMCSLGRKLLGFSGHLSLVRGVSVSEAMFVVCNLGLHGRRRGLRKKLIK